MSQNTSESPLIQDPRKFFIIYKRDSAKDLAEHLHKSLHDRGVDVFLDIKDLEKGLSRKDWMKQRDKALQDSKVIIFIVTQGAYTSKEIKYELRKALKGNKNPLPFIDKELWEKERNKDTDKKKWEREFKIKLNKEIINLTKKQVFFFRNEIDLVRKVGNNTLITKPIIK